MSKRAICIMSVLILGAAIPASADLIGWWKMDQGSGDQVWDYIEPFDDATIAPVNEEAVRWSTDGYKDGCLDFLISTPPFTMVDAPLNGTSVNISEASYSFWMNMPKVFQAWGPIFVLLGGANDHSIECDGVADLYVSSGSIWFGTKNAKVNDEQWHHIAVTYSVTANKIVIYVDGKSAASSASSLTDAISTVRIGGPRDRNQWRRYIGRIDEAAVWNNALTAEEVKSVFGAGPQWALYASNPTPADGAVVNSPNVTLSWTAGETAAQHHVYLSESRVDVNDGAAAADKGTTTATTFSNFAWQLGKTYYWRVDEIEADGTRTYVGPIWSFSIAAKLASLPDPTDGTILVDPNVTVSWTPGSGAVSHDVYFGADAANLPQVAHAQTATTYTPAALLAYDTTYYWRVDEFDGTNTYTGDVWSFRTTPDISITDPNQVGFWNFDRDENNVAIDWSGYGNHGQISGDPTRVDGYYLSALAFDGIDDVVEVPQVLSREATLSLTLMAWIKTDIPGPAGTIARDGSGLLWSDHSGGGDHFDVAVLGTKLAFETGPGGNPTTISNADVVTGDWVHVAVTRTTDSMCQIFLNGLLDNSSVHTGDTRVGSNPKIAIGANLLDSRYFTGTIDEVRAYNRVLTTDEIATAMRSNLLLAWKPSPANGGIVDFQFDAPLTWSAGDGAVQHDLYFGTDKAAVAAATTATADIYKGRLDQTSWTLPEALVWGATYYWRVDEVAADGAVTKGTVWTFKVADYIIVDGFESYTDVEGSRIYETWLDGYGTTTNGSQVGNNAEPFAERTIVHSGNQSMPLNYSNVGSVTVSEAERIWTSPQDWTIHDLNSLVLYIRGRTENAAAPLYVTIQDSLSKSATVVDPNEAAVTTANWQQWSIPFSDLPGVDMSRVKSMVIGIGSKTNPVMATGLIYIDDIEVRTAP
jgi:hypothetical protein